MKKIKLVVKNTRTAQGVTDDGTQVWFSKTNSSWYDYGINGRNVGDEFEVSIVMSNKGNAFVERLNAEKFICEMNIEYAIGRNLMMNKQLTAI